MKWAIGIGVVFLVIYFGAGPIFRAMKKRDFDNMYYGLQDAKRRSGAYVQEEKKPFVTYAERYARGLE